VVDYRHDNLTDDKLRSWADKGRKEIISHGIQSREDEDITELSNLFQEFIHAVETGKLEAKDAGACVREILGDNQDSDSFAPVTLFIDSLAIILDSSSDPPSPYLRDFLIATNIPVGTLREILDAPVLQHLGLARDNFTKKGIRFSTNHLYRQANFNLLREESEGYAKLITELYTTSDVLAPDMPEQTFEKIKALIGTFDLDVGRSLDVILDVAAAVLVKQFRFFVKLLRISSWWPKSTHKAADGVFAGGLPTWATPGYHDWVTSEEDEAANAQLRLARDIKFWDRVREVHLSAFFELGGRQPKVSSTTKAITSGTDELQAVQQSWEEITGTTSPSGNYVAAQLLGFKLLFYYSETRDSSDVLPANLLYLAALLIKIGFISLTDLWPHLSPSDDKMDLVREKKLNDIAEEDRKKRGGGQMNALLMAGVLPQGDDENPNAANTVRREAPKKVDAESKQQTPKASVPKLDEPHEQKVSLLIQLLTIGALPEALFILGRFPWIPEVSPEVLDGIHRILHVCIDKVYQQSRPVAVQSTEVPTKRIPDFDQSGLPKGNVRLTHLTTKKFLRWPTPDRNDHNDAQDYRYYWDEWTDNIPVCQNVDDVFTLCESFLNISGVNIGKDEALLSKMAMIGDKSLNDDPSEENLERWKSLLRRILLPALSHTQANASVVNLIWKLLKRYSMVTRYSLYAEWYEGQTSRLPTMKTAFARAQADTRATMKRVSLTNLSEMARRLAKTSYSSPGVVFRVAFEQLESYPNLIEAFVECAKYFTNLAYDVLVWSLMNSLGKSRSRTQAEHALTTSKWLQALSKFTGKVYRRYSSLTPTPILQYVNHQLVDGNSTDLIILKEFISSMGGIVDAADFTDYQIASMVGGECLRRHTLSRAGDKRFENVRSSQRLARSLTESNLAGMLLINLAQFRQGAIFEVPEDEAHIKYLSSLIDDTHQILIQFLDFLWSNLDNVAYDRAVPPIPELMSRYGLDTSLAFLIGRASLSSRMFPWKSKDVSGKEKSQAAIAAVVAEVDKDGDAAMVETKAVEGSETPSQETIANEEQKSNDSSQIQTALQPLVESVQETVSPDVWRKISPELYVTFWALQLGDLFVPDVIYRKERDRLEVEEKAVRADRRDMTRKSQERKIEQRKELMQLQISLSEERSEHMLRQGKWKILLSKLFQSAFPEPRPSSDSIADTLLEQCFLPRLLLSPTDAEYTYKFIKTLHECNAPGFKLKSLCDRLFNANRLRSLIFTCTVREAEYLGRFLKLILEDLSRWHKNDPVPGDKDKQPLGAYDKEAKGSSESPRLGFALELDENGRPKTFVDHAQFQDLLFRWHKNLNTALKSCLAGTEWMHIRNALTVLKSVLDFFPAIDFMAAQFSTQLRNITAQEAASKTANESEEAHRVDLSVAAQGALSELQRRKSKWMMVQAFRPNSAGKSQTEGSKTSDLRPSAPEFKPQPTKNHSARTTGAEEEDGEVQDGKTKTARAAEDKAANDTLPPKPAVARDSAKRDSTPTVGTPRSSTPKPSQGAKNDSRPNTLPDRPPLNLPSRPDVPIPGHFSERHGGQGRPHERRDGREPRDPRATRDHREPRDPREARGETREPREHRDPRDNWPNSTEWNDRNREPHERRPTEGHRDPARPELMPRRPQAHERDSRPPRDGRRGMENTKEQAPPTAAPAPTATPAPPASEPAMNPERAALVRQGNQEHQDRPARPDRQDRPPRPSRGHEQEPSDKGRRQPPNDSTMDSINPERAAIIDHAQGPPKGPLREEGHGRSRNRSPHTSRPGQDQPPVEPSSTERAPRTHASDVRASGRDPRDHSPMPANFRGDRPIDRSHDRGPNDASRDTSGFKRALSRDNEHDYRAQYDDPNYGRLNAVEPINDAPSGPRGRGRTAPRGHHGPQSVPPRPDPRYNANDTPERPPPTGPSGSSGRGGRRGYDSHSGPPPPPSAPGPMHPDRMRSFSSGTDMSAPGPGMHPDRMKRIPHGPHGDQAPPPPPPPPPPPNPPGGGGHGRHSMGSTMTPDRPRNDPRSVSNMPPTPSSEGGERPRGGGRRQIADINTIMQANKPEPTRSSSGRRGQSRQMLGNSDVQVLTGGSPTTTPAQERQDPMRHESAHKNPANGDPNTPSGARDDHERSRRDRGDNSSRGNRSSRRNSRDRDRERERSPSRADKEPKEHRDYRDRRSGAGPEGSREERESRRSSRSGGSKEAAQGSGSGRRPSGSREGRHRGEGSGPKGGPEDWPSGRGSRGAAGGGSFREGGRPDEGGRKRRNEEGGGQIGDREKRPRR